MPSDEKEISGAVEKFVKEAVKQYDTGHGWSHIERVVRLALHIQQCEGRGDRFTIELAALLHEIGDHKFGTYDAPAEIRKLLGELTVNTNIIDEVIAVNQNISFSKSACSKNKSIEMQIVQDADRLDAMGAIGIARAFNYGGFRGREIYDLSEGYAHPPNLGSDRSKSSSTIYHFYEKLLMLKDLMNTPTRNKLACERHDFMVRYLEQFFSEWNIQ
jgi:uncharacterized protein